MSRLTVKSSTIFISVGKKTQIFRSREEVPASLRKKLDQSTNGLNSGTILIADRRGRDEIMQAIRGMPAHMRARMTATLRGEQPERRPALGAWRLFLNNWAEILLPGALGLVVWLLFSMK